MNINRSNYEEFFLLYIDNELSSADKNAVDLFLQLNPDLAIELELLTQTVLPDSKPVFDSKNLLLKATSENQSLLLQHLDNELDQNKVAEINQLIADNAAITTEWNILQKTKLPNEKIVFENKETLYRKEPSKVIGIKWWRAAAAIFILLGISLFLVLNKKEGIINKDELVKKVVDTIKNNLSNSNSTANNVNAATNKAPISSNNSLTKKEESNKLVIQQPVTTITKEKKSSITYKKESPIVINEDKEASNNLPTPPLQIFNKEESNQTTTANVTPINTEKVSLTNLNASTPKATDKATSLIQPAVYVQPDNESNDNHIFYAKEDNIKKTKLGGFIKKIKRMVERTANIKTGNSIKIANIEIASL